MSDNKIQPVLFKVKRTVRSSNPVDNTKVFDEAGMSMMEITGTGNIQIKNTGGSSASEGGMGTGGGTEKGAGITEPEGGKGKQRSNSDSGKEEDTWDPLKPKEEKGKEKD